MGVFGKISNALNALPFVSKSNTDLERKSFMMTLEAGWIPKTFSAYNTEAAAKVVQFNSVVAACLGVLARTFSEPPIVVADKRTGKILDTHPLSDLFRMPFNPLMWGDIDDEPMSQAELLMYTIYYMAAGGNCYWRKIRANDGRVVAFLPYSDAQMSYLTTTNKRVQGYQFANNGTREVLLPRELIHLKWLNVDFANPVKALSPLVSVAREIGAEEAVQAYINNLLANDAMPRTVFSYPAGVELSPEQITRLKTEAKEKFGGKNYGKPAFLEGGVTIQRLSLGLNELQIDQLMKIPETRVAAMLGVPAIIAGLGVGLDSATYSNFGQAMKVFTDYTLVPLWRSVAEQIQEAMRSEYSDGENLVVRFDTSRVLALQEKENEKQARVLALYTGGVVKLNETRTMLGLPEVPEGNGFKFQIEAPPAPVVTKSLQGAQIKGLLKQGTLFKDDEEAIRTKYWQRQDVHLKAQEDSLLTAIKKAFEKATKDVEKRLKAWQKDNPNLSVPADAGEILDVDTIAAILEEHTGKSVKASVIKSLKTACEEIGENWNSVRSEFDDIIESVVNESSAKITSVADSLKADVQALLEANATANAEEFAQQLSASFADYSGASAWKAIRIARTTATVANGKAQDETFKKFNFIKTWLTERDDDVREDHRAMDGQQADENGYFTAPDGAKAQHPGGFGTTKQDINCRCVIFPVKQSK
jgi:HK97 family phage portal protein